MAHGFLSKLAAVLLALAPLALAAPAAGQGCAYGFGYGNWDRPLGTQQGWVSGALVDNATGQITFSFDARLVEGFTPCLSCQVGRLSGFLDDGVGTGFDYVVVGEWQGLWLSGKGTFQAIVYKMVGGTLVPVGRMHGDYSDPSSSTVGNFVCEWGVC